MRQIDTDESPYLHALVEVIRVRHDIPTALGVMDPFLGNPEWNVANVWWRPAKEKKA
ncbi:MAG: hypothetical protein KA788_12570 [Lacunisphaera sp.]|nr:hypothetical protein [Lacunisphaera sp.]